jgi:adenylate kinase family enzyme
MASAPDQPMRRVLVIGPPGAGKSTLATKLAARLGIAVHYLDLHHWKPGWQYRETADARERVRALVEGPAWVMDGNFAESFDLRMPRADTLVWLDYPRATCIRRILMRTIRDYRKQRPDLPEGCHEQFDLAALRFAWRFPAESRPQIFAAIERYGGHLHVFRLGNEREVSVFCRAKGLV